MVVVVQKSTDTRDVKIKLVAKHTKVPYVRVCSHASSTAYQSIHTPTGGRELIGGEIVHRLVAIRRG